MCSARSRRRRRAPCRTTSRRASVPLPGRRELRVPPLPPRRVEGRERRLRPTAGLDGADPVPGPLRPPRAAGRVAAGRVSRRGLAALLPLGDRGGRPALVLSEAPGDKKYQRALRSRVSAQRPGPVVDAVVWTKGRPNRAGDDARGAARRPAAALRARSAPGRGRPASRPRRSRAAGSCLCACGSRAGRAGPASSARTPRA